MSTILTQETLMGRKARRQRFAFQKVNEFSAEIALLQSKLRASEDALRQKDLESIGLRNDMNDQLSKLQTQVAQLEQTLTDRSLETERLEINLNFLRQEIADLESEKERFRLAHDQVAAELKALKVARAQNEIDEWRAIGRRSPWKRCYQRFEAWLRKDSDDRFVTDRELLRLPPP